jgi:hypothetical protein
MPAVDFCEGEGIGARRKAVSVWLDVLPADEVEKPVQRPTGGRSSGFSEKSSFMSERISRLA